MAFNMLNTSGVRIKNNGVVSSRLSLFFFCVHCDCKLSLQFNLAFESWRHDREHFQKKAI